MLLLLLPRVEYQCPAPPLLQVLTIHNHPDNLKLPPGRCAAYGLASLRHLSLCWHAVRRFAFGSAAAVEAPTLACSPTCLPAAPARLE